jgi:outer membrane translocation and assembly module TamA
MLAGGGITGSDGGTVTGLSLSGGRDTRDGLHSPRRGAHVVIGISGYDALLGSDFRFAQVNGEYRHYVALPAGQTLAAQVLVSTTLGDAPFQALPRLGGSGLMRGHSPALNRDRNVVGAQLEQRLPILWRFGAVGFAGAGAVTSRLRSLDSDAVRYSYGGGLRFALDRQDRFNLRADVGVGRNGAVLYLGAGEAF